MPLERGIRGGAGAVGIDGVRFYKRFPEDLAALRLRLAAGDMSGSVRSNRS